MINPIYRKVRKKSIRRGTVNGRKTRGVMGIITVPKKFIGKKVKVIVNYKSKTKRGKKHGRK